MVDMRDIFKQQANKEKKPVPVKPPEPPKNRPEQTQKPVSAPKIQPDQARKPSAFPKSQPEQTQKPPQNDAVKDKPVESPPQRPAPLAREKTMGFIDIMQSKLENVHIPSNELINRCDQLYQKSLMLVEKTLNDVKNKEKININDFLDVIKSIIQYMEEGRDRFIELAYCNETKEYLAGHIVNVVFLSLVLAESLGYDKIRLMQLGIAAFVYDIKMVDFLELSNLQRALKPKEREVLKNHVEEGMEAFKDSAQEIDFDIVNAILKHHERSDGSGYPNKIRKREIDEMSALIGLMDTFEALTHTRPHKQKILAFDAIKEILNKKALYDQRMLKALLEVVTIFPTGSFVELNSSEIAKVIKVNKKMPLRPVVLVYFDRNKHQYEEKRIIDLSKNSTLFIKKPLREESVHRD